MKKPWLAMLLSFLLVGAGLAYLGKWGWAVLNFLAVVAVLAVVNALGPSSVSVGSVALASASGGLAWGIAKQMNAKGGSQLAGRLPGQPMPGPPPQPVPQIETPKLVPAAGSRGKFCIECGALVGAAKFCPQCGTRTQPSNHCAGCGALFESSTKFCPECGSKVI